MCNYKFPFVVSLSNHEQSFFDKVRTTGFIHIYYQINNYYSFAIFAPLRCNYSFCPYFFAEYFRLARIKSLNSGCGSTGRDLNSG